MIQKLNHCCYRRGPHKQDAQKDDCVPIPDYVHDTAHPASDVRLRNPNTQSSASGNSQFRDE
jgi:hypothetical protein